MGKKLKNRRQKYMQLSCFFGLLFRVRVHLRWQNFVGEKHRLLCCGGRGVTGCARQPARPVLCCSCPVLPWHKSGLLKDPSHDKRGLCLRTFLSFPPLEMHLVFYCHCCRSVSRSPEQLVLAVYWAAGMPICGTSTVTAQCGREHRAVRSELSSPAVSHCDRFQNLSFRFSAHMAVFVTSSHIFKTSFAA